MEQHEIRRIFQKQRLEYLRQEEATQLLTGLGLSKSHLNLLFFQSGLLKEGQIHADELLHFAFSCERGPSARVELPLLRRVELLEQILADLSEAKAMARAQPVLDMEPACPPAETGILQAAEPELREVEGARESHIAWQWLRLLEKTQEELTPIRLASLALDFAKKWRSWVPPPPGIYYLEIYKEVLSRSCVDRRQYLVVPDDGKLQIISFRRNHGYSAWENEAWHVRVSSSPKGLYRDLSYYEALSEPCTLRGIPAEQMAKLLPPEEMTKVLTSRSFTACLVGEYSQGSAGGGPAPGNTWVESEPNCLSVCQDGTVRWTSRTITFQKQKDLRDYQGERCGSAWQMYLKKVGAIVQGHEEISRVLSVQRAHWGLQLHVAAPRLEVIYPPLSVLHLENGRSLDLSTWPLPRKPAILSARNFSQHGHVKDRADECIVSFPGAYAEAWLEMTLETSVACVFMSGEDEIFGAHAIDPEDGRCYCHRIYGRRDFRTLGYSDQAACDRHGGCPRWGCRWFARWRENVELAVARKQRLVTYFFGGQVGEGMVAWDELRTADLWNGHGLGGSQKVELAFLQRMNYSFEMRDVDDFIHF